MRANDPVRMGRTEYYANRFDSELTEPVLDVG
jgi:hypothetical protein